MMKVVLMHAFNASTFSFNKVLLQSVSPLFLSGINALGGAILLCGSLFFKGSLSKIFSKRSFLIVFPIAFCLSYLAGLLRFYALANLSSFYVTFFFALDPFLTALLCYFLRNQKLTLFQLLGIIIASVGSLPMLLATISDQNSMLQGLAIIPLLAIFGYLLVNRYGWIKMSEVTSMNDYSITELVAIMSFIGGLMSLGTSLLIEKTPLSTFASLPVLGMLLYVMAVSTLVCSRTYASLLKDYSVTFLSLTEFITPLFVALYGWLFLHENVTWHFFVSVFLVILGLTIFSGILNKNDKVLQL